MHTKKPFPDPANARSLVDEADIGSGEASPGQLETENIIADIAPLARSSQDERDEHAEGTGDGAGQGSEQREHDASLERDEPSDDLDSLDPVPPEGH